MEPVIGHEISHVVKDSIAEDLGLAPGDRLFALNDRPVLDVFDYQFRQIAEQLLVTIEKPDGEIVEFDIEKDRDEDLGLEFSDPVMSDCATCENHCVFCFIDQLPEGMRTSLYLKDDDMRLSFLTGNYVTLTNLSDDDLDRLISYRMSPVNLSVHATDPEIRTRMMRHKAAGSILERIRRIAEAGLDINAQIVLCPGLNDGEVLKRTLDDLTGIGPRVKSIAIVPVGLTRYREQNNLFKLSPLDRNGAKQVLDEIDRRQQAMLAARGTRLVYAADEIYLKAGRPLPPSGDYEDFPQLENGVGMAALFDQEMADGLSGQAPIDAISPRWSAGLETGRASAFERIILATGTAAAPLLGKWAGQLSERFGTQVGIQPVENSFFGQTITVAGLLTGQDIARQISGLTIGQKDRTCLVLPDCLLKSGENLLLDDYTIDRLAEELDLAVLVCPADAPGLLGLLSWLRKGDRAI